VNIIVEEEHPLKQGLKLFIFWIATFLVRVEEEHPLKQGLKHNGGVRYR